VQPRLFGHSAHAADTGERTLSMLLFDNIVAETVAVEIALSRSTPGFSVCIMPWHPAGIPVHRNHALS